MRAIDAEDHLARLLRKRGVALREGGGDHVGGGADATTAWEAFLEAARAPADEPFTDRHGNRLRVNPDPRQDGDLLLFESGRIPLRPPNGYEWTEDLHGPKVFRLSFTRQFSFEDEDGDYFGMNGLVLTVEFDSDLERRAQVWGSVADVDAWRVRVEQDSAFVEAFAAEAQQFYFGQSDY